MKGEARANPEENRRATRVRKVRPVAFLPRSIDAAPALQTVTANISRGGMLLVTRQDHFPPAGASVLLMPFDVAAARVPDKGSAIEGRIVYTRFSPKAKLRFAGLKFEQDLPDGTARLLGLDGAPDAVTDAVATLEQLEARAPMSAMRAPVMEPIAVAAPMPVAEPLPIAMPDSDAAAEFTAAQRDFALAAAAFMGEWGEARIRKSLGERHALARAKGVEGLRAMKREWTELRGRLREIVAAEIDLRAMAADGADGNPFYNERLDQPRAEIMQAMRMIAGRVGTILVRHGFDDVGAGNDWIIEPTGRGTITYAGAIDYSDAMRESLMRAASAREAMQAAEDAVAQSREDAARGEAIHLWDRA